MRKEHRLWSEATFSGVDWEPEKEPKSGWEFRLPLDGAEYKWEN